MCNQELWLEPASQKQPSQCCADPASSASLGCIRALTVHPAAADGDSHGAGALVPAAAEPAQSPGWQCGCLSVG